MMHKYQNRICEKHQLMPVVFVIDAAALISLCLFNVTNQACFQRSSPLNLHDIYIYKSHKANYIMNSVLQLISLLNWQQWHKSTIHSKFPLTLRLYNLQVSYPVMNGMTAPPPPPPHTHQHHHGYHLWEPPMTLPVLLSSNSAGKLYWTVMGVGVGGGGGH